MKILCVSDTVDTQMENAAHLRRRYNDIDLIVSCGDMPSYYLEFMTSVLNLPLYYVRGNHDEYYHERPPGGEDLNNHLVTFQGISFVGLEGSLQYNNGAVQYTESEMLSKVIGLAPRLGFRRWRKGRGVDVLVAHSPPFGIHDLPDRTHTGFKAFRTFMDWYKPRFLLHGHVHTWDRRTIVETDFDQTHVMNINPVTVLEIEPE